MNEIVERFEAHSWHDAVLQSFEFTTRHDEKLEIDLYDVTMTLRDYELTKGVEFVRLEREDYHYFTQKLIFKDCVYFGSYVNITGLHDTSIMDAECLLDSGFREKLINQTNILNPEETYSEFEDYLHFRINIHFLGYIDILAKDFIAEDKIFES